MARAKAIDNPQVFIPMHRGADGFVSKEAFARFYRPKFKEFIDLFGSPGAPIIESTQAGPLCFTS